MEKVTFKQRLERGDRVAIQVFAGRVSLAEGTDTAKALKRQHA